MVTDIYVITHIIFYRGLATLVRKLIIMLYMQCFVFNNIGINFILVKGNFPYSSICINYELSRSQER